MDCCVWSMDDTWRRDSHSYVPVDVSDEFPDEVLSCLGEIKMRSGRPPYLYKSNSG